MPVSFAADIRPLFTASDIDCMSGLGVERHDHDDMAVPAADRFYPNHAYPDRAHPDRADARDVLAHLTGERRPRMPLGGAPWIDAQIDLFKRWMADGFLA